MKTKKVFYFALSDLLKEKKLSLVAARKKYGFDRQGPGYISKTGFNKLCNAPAQISERIVNVLCNGMDVTPGDLWRERK